jgi:aerobic carbon-monoxide dehydrogenase small subunit
MRDADRAKKIDVRFTVNGKAVALEAYPMARLLDILRVDLKLTGTKEGCGEGECGACCVEIDGTLVNSCLVPAIQADETTIRTIEGVAIEGVAAEDELHALQQAFITHGGAQCGICTPGMILAAANLLERKPHATEAEIREGLAGNLCRCTGYTKIFESVLAVCKHARTEAQA